MHNYDKNYTDVTNVKKREIKREEKNYSDVTNTKKREIKRELIEIEGSKPKKINYDNRKAPEITVMMCGENGP